MKSQARILFCLTQGFWGGAQKYVLDLATNLTGRFDVHIAIGQDEAQAFIETLQNTSTSIQIHQLRHLRRDISPLHDLLAVSEMQKLYKTIQPDIVHLNSSKAGVIGSLAKIPTTKILYTAHGWVFLEPLGKVRQTMYRLLEKYTAPFKDKIIVLSPEEQKVAEEILCVPKEKLAHIPLGIEQIQTLHRDTAREELQKFTPNLQREKFWFGTIANSYTTKGLDILIQSVEQLPHDLRDQAQWIIIGEGPEKPHLQEMIQASNLESSVFLLPFLPNAAQYLSAFDTFVLPSRKEGFPYTLLEALQVGVPIIATKVGGIASLIQDQKTGIVIPPQETEALQKALLFALKHKQRIQEMAEQGKREATAYTVSKMLEKTSELYHP